MIVYIISTHKLPLYLVFSNCFLLTEIILIYKMRCINFQMNVRKVRGMKKQFKTLRERIIYKKKYEETTCRYN